MPPPEPLRPIYDFLAPDPGSDYGALLPFARDRATSEKRIALPSFIREGLLGIVDALAATETGELTDRALGSIVMGSLGVGMGMAPRGALASGGARPGMKVPNLPMDAASRDARARDMGFLRDKEGGFLTLYHGTNREVSPGFSLNPPERATNAASADAGVWASNQPRVAQLYAEAASQRGGTQSILPLRAQATRVAEIRLDPTMTEMEIKGAILDAWDSGFDAVRVKNYTTPDGTTPPVNWVVKEPSQLRSPWAVFDPAKRDSNDLLAARTGMAPVAPPSMRAPEEPRFVGMRPMPEFY
jgi:hypothetical protein